MRLNEITSEPFTVNGIKITPIRVMHHKLPILGFRIANLTYITDANYIADREIDKVKGSDILVLNALRREPHISHFTLAQALEMSAKIAPRVTYFTHMSHYLSHNEIEKELPANIHLAYDGLTVDVQ